MVSWLRTWAGASVIALTTGLFAPTAGDVVITSPAAAVVDGDTLNLGPVAVRLHGIDAPEKAQTCRDERGLEWDCGTAAGEALSKLAQGRSVTCEVLDQDTYGRLIARCSVDGEDLAASLMNRGLAWAFVRFSDDYVALELQARQIALGVWRGASEAPWDYRANRWERAAADAPRPGCPIKGNMNTKGEKIYHTPWSPVYARTEVDEAAGERWFCDEAEAAAAGWRPPKPR